jgi:hypothetical protein
MSILRSTLILSMSSSAGSVKPIDIERIMNATTMLSRDGAETT